MKSFPSITSNGLCEMEKAGANVFIAKRQTSGKGKGVLLGESGRSQNKHPGLHQCNFSNVTFTVFLGYLHVASAYWFSWCPNKQSRSFRPNTHVCVSNTYRHTEERKTESI